MKRDANHILVCIQSSARMVLLGIFVSTNNIIMANTINANVAWAGAADNQKQNLWTKWLNFTDSQVKYRAVWFMFSLVLQGVLFLPIPAFLLYYYNAPIMILAVTLGLFFANVIAGMGGSSTRVMLTLFALSVVVHIIMLAIFMV
jgi:hypothetical protein